MPTDPSRQIRLPILGMSCANCAAAIEKALLRAEGAVFEARVSLADEAAYVRYDPSALSPEALAQIVERAGFRAILPSTPERAGGEEETERTREVRRQLGLVLLGVAFTLPLVAVHLLESLGVAVPLGGARGWIFWALASPVQIFVGADYYRGALRALANRAANMDVLVALGSTVAYVSSAFEVVAGGGGGHLHFEAAALILTLVKVGKLLEARARVGTASAMRELLALSPESGRLLLADGREREVPAHALRAGDVLAVRPGERIPVDGEVVAGESSLDVSALTGESMPVAAEPGSVVFGGTLNLDGALTVRATGVGAETAVARIAALVRSAQASRAPIQRTADAVAAVFVPAILAAAMLTFGIWALAAGSPREGLVRAIAVLVVACPCALGLATPTAVSVGAGLAARRGILFRDAESLERGASIDTVVLDKTGTVTRGAPVLLDAEEWQPGALELVAAVESLSEHPAGRALVEARAPAALPEVSGFRAVPGRGVEALVGGRAVRAGRPDWIVGEGSLPAAAAAALARWHELGATAMLASLDGTIACGFAVIDAPRPEAARVIDTLRARGLRCILLTGDNERAARAVAMATGIDEVLAGALPDGKLEAIGALRAAGRRVAMVGDGVNDAPALAAAELGIAMARGAGVSVEAAPVTLLGGGLDGLPVVLALSRATMRTIRQNLVQAFCYNVALVPLAAGALAWVGGLPAWLTHLHPGAAAAAMALSSVAVVSNSLRLARSRV